jgi:hypothetical protein
VTILSPEPKRPTEANELCWVTKKEESEGLFPTTMLVRFKKGDMLGSKEKDRQSLVVALTFQEGDLVIFAAQRVHGGHAVLNPYLNTVQQVMPAFRIKRSNLKLKRRYRIHCNSSPWGDFLCLKELPRRGRIMQDCSLLMINLWAVFSFSGLREIDTDGGVYFDEKSVIGLLPKESGRLFQMLPFFAEVGAVQPAALQRFMRVSAERAFQLVRPPVGRSAVEEFDLINWEVNRDRATLSPEEGRERAKQVFEKYFLMI